MPGSSSSEPPTADSNVPSSLPAVSTSTHWDPSTFLVDSDPPLSPSSSATTTSRSTLALLILNQEITHRQRILTAWHNCNLRVCADGGANRLYSVFGNEDVRAQFFPDCIIGDLDSLLPHVRTYYASHGVPIIRDPSQDSTDFGKALGWIDSHCDPQNTTIIAWGGFGGRVDQSFHSIHALYYDRYSNNPAAETLEPSKLTSTPISAAQAAAAGASSSSSAATIRPNRKIYILSSLNVTFLLYPGLNTISTPHSVFWKTCGIIPCGQPAIITTKGLEWDLEDTETRFGGMVSTSNHLREEVIKIWTDREIIFTVEVKGGEKEDVEEVTTGGKGRDV